MRCLFLSAVCLALVVSVFSKDVRVLSEHKLRAYDETRMLFDFFESQVLVDPNSVRFVDEETVYRSQQGSSNTFSFTNCEDPKKEIAVPRDVSISPDPIRIPGTLTASGGILVKKPFGAPLKVALKVYKQLFGVWVEVPCIDGFGSCTYDDMCTKLAHVQCPPVFEKIGLPCKCPFKEGNWTVPPFQLDIKAQLPVKVSGAVKVHADVTYNGELVTCSEIVFDLA
ncbi:ganglioside GM2 activator [Aplysia californica]|uniref:Ganglioside GM2 activator n=1 Tax=Aplysia californica TaxID=6500 RepID=A0ABM0JG63_APLCA|nr:ganglioside GM2 activator [Aplysia californica]